MVGERDQNREYIMTSFSVSTSAPNILECETSPILEENVKVQIARAQHKSASIAEDDSEYTTSECHPGEQDDRFLSPDVCKQLVRRTSNADSTSFVGQNEKSLR